MEPKEILNKFVSPYSKDSIIFREGELASHIYFVKTGKILLSKNLNGIERVIGIMNPGDIFGELAILENSHRISKAKAIEFSEIIKLDSKIVAELSSHNYEFMMSIFRAMAKRILDLSDFLTDNLTLNELEFKVISRIIQYVQLNFSSDKYVSISTVKLVDFLAHNFPISEEKIILILERIKDKNLISIDGEIINILDLNFLITHSNR